MSNRNDFDHSTKNPARASPTRFFFGTLRLAADHLPLSAFEEIIALPLV